MDISSQPTPPTPPTPPKPEGKKRTGRGVETLFRTNYRAQLELTQLADVKANIMITINGALISVTIGFVSTQIQQQHWLLYPSALLLVGAVTSLGLAVLAARPSVLRGKVTLDEIKGNQNAMSALFFGAMARMSREEFEEAIRFLMGDSEALYDNLSRDLYGLGVRVDEKYRHLRRAYNVFFLTLLFAVIAFMSGFYTVTS